MNKAKMRADLRFLVYLFLFPALMAVKADTEDIHATLHGEVRIQDNQATYYLSSEKQRREVRLHLGSGKRTIRTFPARPALEGDRFKPMAIKVDRYRAIVRYDLILKTSMNNILYVEVFDQKSAALIRKHGFSVVDPAASEVHFVGDQLYLMDCVGAGPGCSGRIMDPVSGQELLSLKFTKDDWLNVYNTNFVDLGKGRFVFFDSTGKRGILYNGKKMDLLFFDLEAGVEQGVRAAHAGAERLLIVYGSTEGTPAGRALLYDVAERKTVRIYNL